jgi:hypothetical protein
MKISLASLALALLAELAIARNCNAGLNYCGATLNKIGTYAAERVRLSQKARAVAVADTQARRLPEGDGNCL